MLKTTLTAIALCMSLAIARPALAETLLSDHNVVRDHNGHVVHVLSNGTCVRTKWMSSSDPCAIVPPARVITRTRTVLTDDERVVYFEFDRSDLTTAARRNLISVAQRLQKADDVANAQIVGYADRFGSNAYNDRLSARRAETVKNFLVQNGYLNVNVTRLRAMGENHPVTNCPTNVRRSEQIRCLSPDRRVEIELTYVDRVQVTSVESPTIGGSGYPTR